MRDEPTRVVVVRFPYWSACAAALGRSARSGFEPIVRAVVTHVPLVEITAPGIIVFATRGPSRYVGGDEPLAALVHAAVGDALRTLTTDPQHARYGVGIGDGRLAAAIAAHHSVQSATPVVVPVDTSHAWLAQSSVRALVECVDVIGAVGAGVPGADDMASYRNVVSLLERLGLYRFGDVAALREADLIARFGAFGRDLSRLANGQDRHPPLATTPPPDRVCTRRFDAPVESRDAVLATVDDIAVGLVEHLTAHGLAVVRLHVLMESEHGERSERMWYRSDGFGVRSIVESARWQLDAWIQHDAPTSGVVALRIAPEHMVVNAGRQAALWGGERDGDQQAQRAIRRVADVNGAESITLPAWRGGRDPARAFELVRSDAVDLEHRVARGGNGDNGAAVAWRGALPSPAPALVFDSDTAPEIDVLDADGHPVGVDARHAMSSDPVTVCVHHIIHDVVAWAGPWPVEERWWDARRARRAVRVQLLVRERASPTTTRALLVVRERRTWRLSAWYA